MPAPLPAWHWAPWPVMEVRELGPLPCCDLTQQRLQEDLPQAESDRGPVCAQPREGASVLVGERARERSGAASA